MSGRSWVNLLLIPVGITVVLLILAALHSAMEAFRVSILFPFFFLVYFLGSYISFVIRGKRKNR